MACGRPENEFGVGFGMDVDRFVRRLEGREFASLQGLGNGEAAATECNPANGVIGWRLIAAGFAGLQAHGQVVHRRRRGKPARYLAKLAEQYGSGSDPANILRRLVDAFGRLELTVGRQRDPELESACPAGVAGATAVPCTATCLEPFDPALSQNPGGPGRVFVADTSFQQIGQRRDARMRMQPEARERRSLVIEQIKNDKRLESLAEVGRAHQAGDRSVTPAVRAMHDLTWTLPDRSSGFGHRETPLAAFPES